MAKSDQKEMQERRGQSPTGDDARKRLLAGLPVIERRLQLHGVSTAVLEGGSGPPLILLHGPGGYAAHWMRVIPGLVATHRVVVPDLPGHGASAIGDGLLDAERVLAWLDELIEHTCTSSPALVGQLLSGAIAARFSLKHAGRVSRLVLIDTFGLTPFDPAPEFGFAINDYFAQPTEHTHEHLWRHCAFDLDGLRRRMGQRWQPFTAYNLDRALTPSVQAAFDVLMQQFGLPAIPAENLARIAIPTSLIWGRHDRATSLSVAEAAHARFGWPLHIIERCADDPPIEQPEAFLEALRTVLGDPCRNAAANRTRHDTRAAWDRIAPGYDRAVTPTHTWLANQGLRRAGLRAGMRFLDVAAGSGALSIPATRLGAEVLATDQSAIMLELLQARARPEGLEIETCAMDGHQLELADNSFDIAGSQFGVMLFQDMPKGIREMARVVKKGGRVLMTVLSDPSKIEFFTFLIGAIQSVRPEFTGPPMDPPPLPFQLQDPERLRRELAAAGLTDITVETITEPLEFRTGKDLWDWQLSSNPIVESLLSSLNLTDHERGLIQQTLDRMVRERSAGRGPAVLTVPINIGVGTK